MIFTLPGSQLRGGKQHAAPGSARTELPRQRVRIAPTLPVHRNVHGEFPIAERFGSRAFWQSYPLPVSQHRRILRHKSAEEGRYYRSGRGGIPLIRKTHLRSGQQYSTSIFGEPVRMFPDRSACLLRDGVRGWGRFDDAYSC